VAATRSIGFGGAGGRTADCVCPRPRYLPCGRTISSCLQKSRNKTRLHRRRQRRRRRFAVNAAPNPEGFSAFKYPSSLLLFGTVHAVRRARLQTPERHRVRSSCRYVSDADGPTLSANAPARFDNVRNSLCFRVCSCRPAQMATRLKYLCSTCVQSKLYASYLNSSRKPSARY